MFTLTRNTVKKLMTVAKTFRADETGAAMVEYAVMLALIAAVSIAVVISLGNEVKDTFEALGDLMQGLIGG